MHVMTVPAKAAPAADIMESVLIKGDLARLTSDERVTYYNAVCKSIGLNPLTQPLAYMNLQGRLQLYAKRDAADQLRRLRNVSVEILHQGLADDLYSVHVQATDPTGRKDEDLGVVPLPANVKGEFRANMILKAVTKAKRRVTLSICGLGFLDETEVESIPGAKDEGAPSAKQLSLAEEIQNAIPDQLHADAPQPTAVVTSAAAGAEEDSPPDAPAALSLEDMARQAAMHGPEQLQMFLAKRTAKEKRQLSETFGVGKEDLRLLYPQPGRE
jgi:hypothetical protein